MLGLKPKRLVWACKPLKKLLIATGGKVPREGEIEAKGTRRQDLRPRRPGTSVKTAKMPKSA